jgi:16S rRNA (guanine527-N7)-methyltransferase
VNALDLLEAQALAWGLRIDEGQRGALMKYAGLLATYDRANVIGTRDLDGILLSHVLDSLGCFLHEPLSRAGSLADVGSGGGLPGIPIAIMRPELSTVLVESTGKKATFLRHAVDCLGLGGVRVANARAEELGRASEHRGAYGAVTTRAVARLSVVAEYCVPMLEVGGSAIVMKSRIDPEELSEGTAAAGTLGAKVAGVVPVLMLPEVGHKERNLVIVEKIRATPRAYPRRPGTAVKKPLGS